MTSEQFNESAFHESDILFWANQLSKLVYYIHLAVNEPDLKKKARILFEKWEKFITTLPVMTASEGLVTPKPDVSVFYDFERYGRSRNDYLTNTNLNHFNSLISVTQYLVEFILVKNTNTVENTDACHCGWTGFLYPTQLEAILLCVNYAKKKVNCDLLCDNTTVKFWNLVNTYNLYTVIHLLDPSEKFFIQRGYKITWRLHENEEHSDCKRFERCSVENNQKIDKLYRTMKCEQIKNLLRGVLLPLLLTVYQRFVQRALKDQTWIYCRGRKRCCRDLSECFTKIEDLNKFISKEGNKCCKKPEPFKLKKCDHV